MRRCQEARRGQGGRKGGVGVRCAVGGLARRARRMRRTSASLLCVLWITHKSAPPLAPVSVSGGRFRCLPPARNVDRLRRPGLAGVEPAQPKFLAAHPAATAPVISLRSPRAGGCKSSPPLTFFKLGDSPLDRPQQAPAGRARPIVPWKGANWCAAAVGLPAAPQCQPVLRRAF